MKEQDNLERFIQENRRSFDDKEPSDLLWERIATELPIASQQKSGFTITFLWKAAAVFFFLATATLGVLQWQNSQQVATQSAETDDFYMAENYYQKLIHEKQQALQTSGAIKPELMTKFNQDIHVLDSLYGELKNEISDGGNLNRVQDAMVQNLKLRIEILNYQLEILESIKTTKENETSI